MAGIRGITTANADAVAVLIDSSGQLGTISSSQRYKQNIQTMGIASQSILDLNPVTFTYKTDKMNTKQFGLIAEEVEEIFPDIVVRNANGQPETVQYHILPVLLLNEVKKLQNTINSLTTTMNAMSATMNTMNETMNAMSETMNAMHNNETR